MTNGDTLHEIKSILTEKDMSTTAALRLSLEIQAQIYEKLDKQDSAIKELEKRVKIVEDASIVLWVQRNPRLSLFLLTVYILIASLIDVRMVVAKALGL